MVMIEERLHIDRQGVVIHRQNRTIPVDNDRGDAQQLRNYTEKYNIHNDMLRSGVTSLRVYQGPKI